MKTLKFHSSLDSDRLALFLLKGADLRFFVPDLSPAFRGELENRKIKWVFVGESPHISEVEPEQVDQRRPLCGAAGKQWWSLLSELKEQSENSDVSLNHLVQFCYQHQIAVMNAVQYPLDPKVAAKYPKADPIKNLGFGKMTGEHSYKKIKANLRVQAAVQSLKDRLTDPCLKGAKICCLGNDSEWFVRQALGVQPAKVPHPSAWWRKGGFYGKVAKEKLIQIFSE